MTMMPFAISEPDAQPRRDTRSRNYQDKYAKTLVVASRFLADARLIGTGNFVHR
jgi:hypothetical protein